VGGTTIGTSEEALAKAICLIVCGVRVTQANGVTTELEGCSGTGFAVSQDGCIVTNGHVVAPVWSYWDAARSRFTPVTLERRGAPPLTAEAVIWVFFGKKNRYEASIVQYQLDGSSGVDVCLLKIKRSGGLSLPLSSQARPRRGTEVVSFGFPDYARQPLTHGEKLEEFLQEKRLEALEPSKVEDALKDDDFELTMTKGAVTKIVNHGLKQEIPWIMHDANIFEQPGGEASSRRGEVPRGGYDSRDVRSRPFVPGAEVRAGTPRAMPGL
jgi:hypothetical protein